MKMPALWHFHPGGAEVLALCSQGARGCTRWGLSLGLGNQEILTEEDNDLADN